MNRRFLLSLFSLIFLALTGWPQDVSGQDWVKKMFNERVHDFGDVPLGETPVYKFSVTNPFTETFHIRSVQSSCGCTIATASKNELQTHETGEIVCKYNTPAVGTGFKQATITVRFDRPYVGEMQLTVKGNVVSAIRLQPETLDFGQIVENKFPVKQLNLSVSGAAQFRIADVKSTYEHISVQLQPLARRNGVVSYNILAQLRDTAPMGFNQGELYLVYQDGPARQMKRIPVKFNAKVVPALQLSPDRLNIGPLKPGEKFSKKIIVKSDEPFTIADVKCFNDAFEVQAGAEAKKVHIVEVIYTGENKSGRHECELEFVVNYQAQAGQPARSASNSIKAIVDLVADSK